MEIASASKTMVTHATVIGLGLIGSSILRVLKETLQIPEIIGIDIHQPTIDLALTSNLITLGSTTIIPEIAFSQIVFICTPVGKTLSWIEQLLPVINQDCIMTDVGSVKSEIIGAVEQMAAPFHFVGGHPMAGSEKTGFVAGNSHLFENAWYILTPCSKSTQKDLNFMTDLVSQFGSIPCVMTQDLHDQVTGAVSHVPHIISAALVNLVQQCETPENDMQRLAAGGFKDITRISSSSPEMWQHISSGNKTAIVKLLDHYLQILQHFRHQLLCDNQQSLFEFFNQAKQYRDSFTDHRIGLIPQTYELLMDVEDKPGIISQISSLLAMHKINIKNIHINNNREFEGGILIIHLPDKISLENAYKVLTGKGFQIRVKGGG